MIVAKLDASARMINVRRRGEPTEIAEDVAFLIGILYDRMREEDDEEARIFREELTERIEEADFWSEERRDYWRIMP